MGEVVEIPNRYDKKDRIKRVSAIIAGPLKLAAYRVRDPETNVWSGLQFHMTYDNHVMAVMEEDSAKLFARFVEQTLNPQPPNASVVAMKEAA